MRYLELGESAQAGEYRLTVTGLGPARFTLAVGTTERFGTPVENVPNRSDGSAGVQRWYATPPPTSTTASSTASSTIVTSTTAVATDVADTAASTQTTPEPGPSPADGGSNVFAMGIGALVVMAAALAWLLWQRRGRDAADDVRT